MHPISKCRRVVLLCSLLAPLAPSESMAQQPAADGEVALSASLLHFDYQEFSDYGKLLDREEGFIPGLVLAASKSLDAWVLAGDLAYHRGDTPYTGYTTSGVPIKTTTRQTMADVALRAEYWPQSDRGQFYAFYLGTACHQWERNILPTTTASGTPVNGLFETYSWWSGFLGVKAKLYDTAADSLLMDLRLLQTVNPAINVSFGGNYDDAKLPLGERWGARLALPWRHGLHPSANLAIEPYAEYYEFGRSASAPLTSSGSVVGSVFEPRSQTLNMGVLVGVSQRF